VNNRAALDEHIKNKINRYSSNELIDELRKLGIPIGNVNTVKQALASQQTQAKNMVLNIQHQKIGSFKTLGTPLRMHGTPSSIRYAPPLLGEHTDEILSEYLHLNTEDLSKLKNKKVIA